MKLIWRTIHAFTHSCPAPTPCSSPISFRSLGGCCCFALDFDSVWFADVVSVVAAQARGEEEQGQAPSERLHRLHVSSPIPFVVRLHVLIVCVLWLVMLDLACWLDGCCSIMILLFQHNVLKLSSRTCTCAMHMHIISVVLYEYLILTCTSWNVFIIL